MKNFVLLDLLISLQRRAPKVRNCSYRTKMDLYISTITWCSAIHWQDCIRVFQKENSSQFLLKQRASISQLKFYFFISNNIHDTMLFKILNNIAPNKLLYL